MAQPRYLLDTNICIYIRRERPRPVLERFRALPPGAVAISVVTYGELAYGVYKSPEPDRAMQILEELIALVPVMPTAADVAEAYGIMRGALARGQLIGNNDLWMAAHAKRFSADALTGREPLVGDPLPRS